MLVSIFSRRAGISFELLTQGSFGLEFAFGNVCNLRHTLVRVMVAPQTNYRGEEFLK